MDVDDLATKMRNRDYDFIFKIVVTGDSGVGKSQLLSRFAKNQFSTDAKNTIGVEFATKVVEIDGHLICVHVWDTAGQKRYRAVSGAYYKGAVGAMIVYDITRLSSFQNAKTWLEELDHYTSHESTERTNSVTSNEVIPVTTMLVGNKLDMRHLRSVSSLEAKSMARSKNIFFQETSALDATNVEKAFRQVVQEIYDRVRQRQLVYIAQVGAGLQSGAQVLNMWKGSNTKSKPITTRPTLNQLKPSIRKISKNDIQDRCPKYGCLC